MTSVPLRRREDGRPSPRRTYFERRHRGERIAVGFAATEVAAVRLVRAPGTGFSQAPSVADRKF